MIREADVRLMSVAISLVNEWYCGDSQKVPKKELVDHKEYRSAICETYVALHEQMEDVDNRMT